MDSVQRAPAQQETGEAAEPAPAADRSTSKDPGSQADSNEAAKAQEDDKRPETAALRLADRPCGRRVTDRRRGLLLALPTGGLESTDDAYTDGRAIDIAPQVARRRSPSWTSAIMSLSIRAIPSCISTHGNSRSTGHRPRPALDTREGAISEPGSGGGNRPQEFPCHAAAGTGAVGQTRRAVQAKARADLERQKSLPKAATTQQEVDERRRQRSARPMRR